MFILKHKQFPFYLTWEADDEVFANYKDQINMEIKDNGLNNFSLAIVNGNQFATGPVDKKKADINTKKSEIEDVVQEIKDQEVPSKALDSKTTSTSKPKKGPRRKLKVGDDSTRIVDTKYKKTKMSTRSKNRPDSLGQKNKSKTQFSELGLPGG